MDRGAGRRAWSPRYRQPWRKDVRVRGAVIRCGVAGHVARSGGPELPLVAQTCLQGQCVAETPLVQRKQGEILVALGTCRIAVPLHVRGGEPERKRLHGGNRRWQKATNSRKGREDEAAAEVQRQP